MLPSTDFIRDSKFLITGGTGSFGKTMAKHLVENGAALVRIFSRDESKQFDLKNSLNCEELELVIGDVRDSSSLKKNLKGIDFVFHAAALKHVPASEENPFEYIKTNAIGSHNLLQALMDSNVQTAVFLSTDKAVYPINAMGMTKALMEKLVRSSAYTSETNSCITRYGNVIASRGSIIPQLIAKLKSNQAIRITDWRMTRFMMSLQDSVNLVLHAMRNGKQGDLFVQKAPAADLRTILSAVEIVVGKKAANVVVTGIRAGEKIHETLLNSEERTYAKDDDTYFQVPSIVKMIQDLENKVRIEEEFTSNTTRLLSIDALVKLLESNDDVMELVD